MSAENPGHFRPAVSGHRMALYGNIAIEKAICPECGKSSFVRNGESVCCSEPVDGLPSRFKRESLSPDVRKLPPVGERRRVLELQENCCFYCGAGFGTRHQRKGRWFTIRVHWDHQVPYSFSQDNRPVNFVAACHVCNLFKSNKVFADVE